MKRPTMTFGDMANDFKDTFPERKCKHYDFPSWSVEREPTKEEKKENPNAFMYVENQVFFYRPFVMTDMDTGKEVARF